MNSRSLIWNISNSCYDLFFIHLCDTEELHTFYSCNVRNVHLFSKYLPNDRSKYINVRVLPFFVCHNSNFSRLVCWEIRWKLCKMYFIIWIVVYMLFQLKHSIDELFWGISVKVFWTCWKIVKKILSWNFNHFYAFFRVKWEIRILFGTKLSITLLTSTLHIVIWLTHAH